MAKKTNYSILIVCEGSNTEPNYFKEIREKIISEGIWKEGIAIDIKPKPPLEIEEEPKPNRHKKARKRRQLKTVPAFEEEEIEEEYKAFPTRFVREAQLGLEDGTYDETWAVFDKDYHPKHKEAFELAETAIEGKFVKIAFSSIAFEHWIILHFERNITAFLKSECKENDKTISCGTDNHIDDCGGIRCTSGYLKVKNHLSSYSKKSHINLYASLKGKTEIAIQNASWLRSKISGKPIYDLNPYTDLDFLVKRLFRIDQNFHWLSLGSQIVINNLGITIHQLTPNQFSISILNKKNIAYIFNPEIGFYSDNLLVQTIDFASILIEPGIEITKPIEVENRFLEAAQFELRLKISPSDLLILELI